MISSITQGFANFSIPNTIPSFEIFFFEMIKKIKEVSFLIFLKIKEFSTSYRPYTSEGSTKTYAFICCATLLLVFFLSMFRKKGPALLPPPTPVRHLYLS